MDVLATPQDRQVQQSEQVQLEAGVSGRFLITLYETAILYAHRAAASIRAGKLVTKGQELQRVSSIVTELTGTLEHAVAPELCDNLEQLYCYLQLRLVHASAKMDPEAAEEVVTLLTTLRDAWVRAVELVESGEAVPKVASS